MSVASTFHGSTWRTAQAHRQRARDPRLIVIAVGFVLAGVAVVARLFSVQILQHDWYAGLASGQRELFQRLYPERGEIFVHDRQASEGRFPIATNERRYTIYAVPAEVGDPRSVAGRLAPLLGFDRDAEVALAERLGKQNDPYEPIARNVTSATRDAVLALNLTGIASEETLTRFYPDRGFAAHLTGFVGEDEHGVSGRYGIEGALDDALTGSGGTLEGERDPAGRWIVFGSRDVQRAVDGADIVLTIEREVQIDACRKLTAAVAEHKAAGGSVVILHPRTGAVRALCSVPTFDPNAYADAPDIAAYQSPIIAGAYEAGSVFKPITMAAAIDAGAVTPSTTFQDTGSLTVGGYTITNTDGRVYHIATMADVLKFSINTGAVYAARALGMAGFRRTVERFGFGAATGIDLPNESPGDLGNLAQGEDVYLATASYGQGMTVTPLQLAAAYAAIANGGTLYRPYLVEEVVAPDGTRRHTEPTRVHQVISQRTATLLQGMLVAVVQDGYPKRAGVKGYRIGGKTGTAQIPYPDRPGYSQDMIHTFVGIGPIEQPTFAMVIRIDRPQRRFADSTAAPLFGDIAKFLVQYDGIPPRVERAE